MRDAVGIQTFALHILGMRFALSTIPNPQGLVWFLPHTHTQCLLCLAWLPLSECAPPALSEHPTCPLRDVPSGRQESFGWLMESLGNVSVAASVCSCSCWVGTGCSNWRNLGCGTVGLKDLHLASHPFTFQACLVCSAAFDFPDSSPWGDVEAGQLPLVTA